MKRERRNPSPAVLRTRISPKNQACRFVQTIHFIRFHLSGLGAIISFPRPPPVFENHFFGHSPAFGGVISIGGRGSTDKGFSFFPQNAAAMPIHRTGASLSSPIFSARLTLGIPPNPIKKPPLCDDDPAKGGAVPGITLNIATSYPFSKPGVGEISFTVDRDRRKG